MSTPKDNLAPKNYIASGISKSLLTPCRRVGLSRTKKTPTNITSTPQNAVLKEEMYKTPVDINKSSNVQKLNANLEDTPKKTIFESDNNAVKVNHTKSVFNNKRKKCVDIEDVSQTVINVKREEISANVSSTEDVSNHISFQTLNNSAAVNVQKDSESNSPSSSPLIHKVTVQVHQPAVKRSINFESQDSLKTNFSKASKGNMLPVADTGFHILEDPDKEQNSLVKSKKRKLRLNSDDFENVKDEIENNSKMKDQKKSASKTEDVRSENHKPAVGTTLAKFNTEDYLNAYSQNPKEFQNNLEIGNAFIDNDDDDLTDFMPNRNFKVKKRKNQIIERKDHKSYMAVLCPIEISRKEKTNEEIVNESKILKETLLTKKLTVSLECTSNNSIRKENTKLAIDKINHHPKEMKSYILEDSDDEMFTSSLETDKKQRENLLQLISIIESEVKQKEEIVERLKRAQLYKKIHSPVKVKKSSEIWVKGCQNSLKDLLSKMQEHGPIICMETLVKNLNIPDHIIGKLKLF